MKFTQENVKDNKLFNNNDKVNDVAEVPQKRNNYCISSVDVSFRMS